MTIEEVKQIIANSKFDPGLKQRLVLILPRLGKYTLNGLGKELSREDSVIIADYLVSLWESFVNLLEGIRNKEADSANNLSNFLDDNLPKFNDDDQSYLLNFVLDIRSLVRRGSDNSVTGQYGQLLDFEIKLFWQLPEDEILFLFRNHLLYLLRKINLLLDTQAAAYEHDWDYRNDFSKIFTDPLLKNIEVLGAKQIGVWIRDYINFSAPSSFRKDVVQVAEFITKDPSVQKLTNGEKSDLSEILKLYVWLLEPKINEHEVRVYREEVKEKEAERIQKIIDKEIEDSQISLHQTQPVKTPPVVPTPRNAPGLRAFGDVGNQRKQEVGSMKYELGINGNAGGNPSSIIHNPLPNQVNRPLPKPTPPPVLAAEEAAEDRPFGRMNFQDILKSREQSVKTTSGLTMGGNTTVNNPSSIIHNPLPNRQQVQTPPDPLFRKEGERDKTEDIDRKLEELGKRAGRNN